MATMLARHVVLKDTDGKVMVRDVLPDYVEAPPAILYRWKVFLLRLAEPDQPERRTTWVYQQTYAHLLWDPGSQWQKVEQESGMLPMRPP